MWRDVHAVGRWEWKGSRSDHCCGQAVAAGAEGELGSPRGRASCALDTDRPSLWQRRGSGTDRQDFGCLHLRGGWTRPPGSRAFLAFCSWFSRVVHNSSIWHIWVQDGPTCKIKACGWTDPPFGNISVEAWTCQFSVALGLVAAGCGNICKICHVAWLAELPWTCFGHRCSRLSPLPDLI